MVKALAIAAIVAGIPTTALAQPAPNQTTQTSTTRYTKYTVAVDCASMGLLLGSLASEGSDGRDTGATLPLFVSGAVGILVGSPIVHLTRARYGRAAGSFGLRSAAAVVGGVAGTEACGFYCTFAGVLVGVAAASALDSALMTHETTTTSGWTPVIKATGSGGSIGFATAF